MRVPNPPKVFLSGLTEESQRKVVQIALLVVAELAAGREWNAYHHIEHADTTFSMEEKLALATLWDSQQAATIVSLREAAK